MAVTPRGSSLVMSEAENNTFESYNANQRQAEAFTRGSALAYQSAPPSSPTDGAVYIVLGPGSGAWSGQGEKVAERLNGAWVFYPPILNDVLVVGTTSPTELRFNGTSWVAYGGGVGGGVTSVNGETGAVTLNAADVGAGDRYLVENLQTGTSYTLVLADDGRPVAMDNAAANTVFVPTDASVAFPVGTVILISQIGTGQTTIAPVSGTVTIQADPGYKIAARYGEASLRKRGPNLWILSGKLAA